MSFKDVTTLGSVVKCFDSKRIPLSTREREMKQGRVPYYGAAGIIDYVNEPIFSGLYLLMGEDGSVSKDDGTPVLQLVSGEFWINNHAHVLQGETDIDTRYLYYALGKTNIQGFVTGAVQPKLNQANMNRIPVYYPEKSIRERIVDILGGLDDKIELNRQTNATLEAIAQAIFKEWFVDFNYPGATGEMMDSERGLIPNGWRIGNLGEMITNHDRKRIPLSSQEREKRKGSYPYYGAASILGYVNDFLFDGVYLLLGEDGTVITEDGSPVLQYVAGKFWVNNHAHVLQGKTPFSTEFLLLYLRNTNIRHIVTGAVQPKINQGNMNDLSVIIPDRTTLLSFQEIIAPFFSTILENETEIRILEGIREILIPKLINGAIEV